MDNNSQLINYIVQELKRGVPEASIRSTLLQNGWPAEPVHRAFTILQQNESAAVPVQGTLPAVQQSTPQQPKALPVAQAQTPQQSGNRTRTKRSYKKPLLIIGILLLVIAASVGTYLFLNKPLSPEQRDTARKDALSSLADELTMYYSSRGTYPTRGQINSPDFAGSEDGFETKTFRDPSWKGGNKSCSKDDGTPTFSDARADGCFAYRVTARNGADCEGSDDSKCTRVVVTATLESGDPYIVTLDQNDKQEY